MGEWMAEVTAKTNKGENNQSNKIQDVAKKDKEHGENGYKNLSLLYMYAKSYTRAKLYI